MVKFTRLLWSVDWEGSLRQVLMQPAGQAELRKWLQTNAPSDTAACEQVISNGPGADQAASTLAMESFPKFVQSKACLPLVRQLLGSSADDMRMQEGALWPLYKVPDDCAGWVHSFTAVAASLPACIVLSDMAMPGNPMFYVNQAAPASFAHTRAPPRMPARGPREHAVWVMPCMPRSPVASRPIAGVLPRDGVRQERGAGAQLSLPAGPAHGAAVGGGDSRHASSWR